MKHIDTSNMTKKPIKIEHTDIYGVRVLVFMEIEPQSNKYYQILLTPDMYKNMTATIAHPTGKLTESGLDEYALNTSEEEYVLPDLSEAYEEGSF